MGKKYNMFVDAHCHISSQNYNNPDIIEMIIEQTYANRIQFLIVNGGYDKENEEVNELAQKHEVIKACVGIHPEGKPLGEKDYERVEAYINENTVGIGEIGLEYFYDWGCSREVQIKSVKAQIKLAKKYNLPVVVHLRDKEDSNLAYEDFYQIMLENRDLRVMLHTYAGDLDYAKKFLEFPNLYFSFSGVVTFGSSDKTREVIKFLPLDRILTETDAPFLRVHPYTGEKNEPNTVLFVSYYIAGLKGVGMDKFVDRINRNLRKLFNLK
ncbi:TatD family hydrolase [Mycoplasma corogypsi]|uniref:TatD family hydrolase n=1 Tax=Mycoplasma corogypsi TaxID=2106 RepID=UPI003873977B